MIHTISKLKLHLHSLTTANQPSKFILHYQHSVLIYGLSTLHTIISLVPLIVCVACMGWKWH